MRTEPEGGAGDGVAFVVEDDGAGMSEEVAARIFDPFFTTREVGQGAGLGLTVCLRVAEEHGGQLAFTTAPGKGTAFRLVLPRTRDAPERVILGAEAHAG